MNINSIIKQIDINNDLYIIVGVSAGPDSMALLHLLKNNIKAKIVCAHINHNIRKESIEEAEYLKKYCQDNNIIFEYYKIDKYIENNFENEARKKRYAFYEKILKKYHSHHLFLAHHGDDLIETVLMKIVRGSNLEGYAGIKFYSKVSDYIIIRPLLNLTKEDILNYNQINHIKYYLDSTNQDQNYTRNRYRQNFVPLLKQEDKLVHLKFLKYSNTLQEYNDYIEEIISNKIKNTYTSNTIDISLFNQEHPFIKKNIIFYILTNIYNNKANIIKNKHIEEIIKLTNSNKANATISLPKNYQVKKAYNKLYFEKKPKETTNYKFLLKKTNRIDNIIIKQETSTNSTDNSVCCLNSKDIIPPLYIRNYKEGDYMYVLGLNGKKKIKDIYIDEKIPKDKRKSYPLLVDSTDTILWIPNIKKSKYNIKNNQFCDIILTSYKEREEKNEEKE